MIDFRTMKKVGDDGKIAIMQHERGHQIKIVKSALSPLHRKQLEKLPLHQADGGPTPEQLEAAQEVGERSRAMKAKATQGTTGMGEGAPDRSLEIEGENSEFPKVPTGFTKATHLADGTPDGPIPDPTAPFSDDTANAETAEGPVTKSAGASADNPSLLHAIGEAVVKHLAGNAEDGASAPLVRGAVNFLTKPLTLQDVSGGLGSAASAASKEEEPDLPGTQPTPTTPSVQAQPSPVAPQQSVPTNYDPSANIYGAKEALAGAQATGAAGKAYGDEVARVEALAALDDEKQANYQEGLRDKFNTIQQMTEDALKEHIKPNHYMQAGGAPRRIATAIGLLLGGISSGQTKQPNPALTFLNKQIENDLEAQRTDMANKHNLLGALAAQYKDQGVAENMYRAFRQSMFAHQIVGAGATAQGAQAKAQTQSAVGAIKMNQLTPLIIRSNAIDALNNGGSPTGVAPRLSPEQRINLQSTAGLINEEQAKAATTALGKVQAIEQLRNNLHHSFDTLDSKFMAGTLSPALRQSAMLTFTGPLAKELENRYNDTESQAQMRAVMPGRIESASTRAFKKNGIDRLMDEARAPYDSALKTLRYPVSVPKNSATQVVHVSGIPYIKDAAGLHPVPGTGLLQTKTGQ